jgi:hypothetical protein
MITGANTNVRHRGIVFHVQTEDSGRAYPHIISHVYHGGTILASEKTDYADRVDSEDLEGLVRGLIEDQHRAMVRKLQSGGFDGTIEERLGGNGVSTTEPVDTPTPVPELAEAAPTPAPSVRDAPKRTFGEGIVSQKPLDEVILDYLAEKARGRASGRAEGSARKSSPDG